MVMDVDEHDDSEDLFGAQDFETNFPELFPTGMRSTASTVTGKPSRLVKAVPRGGHRGGLTRTDLLKTCRVDCDDEQEQVPAFKEHDLVDSSEHRHSPSETEGEYSSGEQGDEEEEDASDEEEDAPEEDREQQQEFQRMAKQQQQRIQQRNTKRSAGSGKAPPPVNKETLNTSKHMVKASSNADPRLRSQRMINPTTKRGPCLHPIMQGLVALSVVFLLLGVGIGFMLEI